MLIAKTTYTIDDYVSMGGLENYGGTANPPGHLANYDATYTLRGNVTGRTVFTDVGAGTSITWLRKIDIFGGMVKEELSCCNEETIISTETNYWALPEVVTKGTAGGPQLTVTRQFDFNTSLSKISTDPNSLQTQYGYDAAMRPTSVIVPTGASTTSSYATLSSSRTVSYDDGGVQKTIIRSTTYDGWGQVIKDFNEHGGHVNSTYDAMGRVVSRTNPFTAGGTPGPTTGYQYDALGRAKLVTLPDHQNRRYKKNLSQIIEVVIRIAGPLSERAGRVLLVDRHQSPEAVSDSLNLAVHLRTAWDGS